MMFPPHFIPIVSQVDELLPVAVNSSRSVLRRIVLIDNRDSVTFRSAYLPSLVGPVEIIRPCVPLTTAQTMNLMTLVAKERGCDYFTWQHLDAAPCDGSTAGLIEVAERLTKEGADWGVLLTKSELPRPYSEGGRTYRFIGTDALAAYSLRAIADVGGWDSLRFPYYCLDSDIHQRLLDREWSVEILDFMVDHRGFSQTKNADPERHQVVEDMWPVWRHLYSKKHGRPLWDYPLFE